jgi:hypothetical protein
LTTFIVPTATQCVDTSGDIGIDTVDNLDLLALKSDGIQTKSLSTKKMHTSIERTIAAACDCVEVFKLYLEKLKAVRKSTQIIPKVQPEWPRRK